MNLSRSIFDEVNKTTQEDKVNEVLNFLIDDEISPGIKQRLVCIFALANKLIISPPFI